ncbi:MAG: HAMP domain-containing sensor histidine kinase, partial [Thermoleophilia bacterium]
AAVGSAPVGDGRFVYVSTRENQALAWHLWRGLLLVLGTGALAGAGWALWSGLARRRDLERVCRTICELGGDGVIRAGASRPTSIEHIARAVDVLRLTRIEQAQTQAELVGIVAHDLRSPLTGICLASDRLERSSDRTEKARARSLIQRECDRMAAIADDVLELCRDTHSTVSVEAKGIAADQLLLDVVNRLRTNETASQPIDLVQASDAVGCVDPRVARAVGNLAENAARHAPPGTEVSLGVQQLSTGAVEFVVEDSGPGFAAGALDEAFSQGVDRPGRAGLGLASVRRVAAAVGGEARFDVRPGGGTRVAFRAPRADGTA